MLADLAWVLLGGGGGASGATEAEMRGCVRVSREKLAAFRGRVAAVEDSLTFRDSHVTVPGTWHGRSKLWWAGTYRGCGEGALAVRAVCFGLRGGFRVARCVGGEKWLERRREVGVRRRVEISRNMRRA